VIYVLGFILYVRPIWRTRKLAPGTPGKIEPQKASWTVWAILDTIIMFGMYAKHALNGQILGAIAGTWTVVGLAFKFGKRGWDTRDKVCLAIGLAGIGLWKLFASAELGIICGLAGALIAAWPTYQETWNNPGHEDKLAWTTFSVGCVFALIAVPQWDIANAAMPIVFAAIDIPVTLMIYFRPRLSANGKATTEARNIAS